MKSIMDKKDGTCYLCRMLYGDYTQKMVQEHHVFFGTAKRKLSEKYGLKVYLCLYHHTGDINGSQEAVHRNKEMADLLHAEGQKAFMKVYPEKDFLQIFGKSWLSAEEIREIEENRETAAEKEVPGGKAAAEPEGFLWNNFLDEDLPL